MQEVLLIQRCQNGDRTAQRWLFDEYYKYVYTICHRYVRNHHDAEDVVSIVFNKVFKHIAKVNELKNNGLKRWIQTISINESLRFINQKAPVDYTADSRILEPKVTERPEEGFDAGGKLQSVKQAINEMPEGYRTIFLMNVVEGLSHTEIAQYLGISRNTSKSQMVKARKYLQSKLKADASR